MDKLTDDFRRKIDTFVDEWNNTNDYITAHTSGSTGTPKNILLPKEMVRRSAQRSISHFGIDTSSRLHLCLSPDYIAGKMLIVRALEAGCRLTYEAPTSEPLKCDTDTSPITLISLVGSQLQGLVNNFTDATPQIRHMLLGGAPLNGTMRSLALSGDWQCWESYGMTETASHIALRHVTQDDSEPFHALTGIRLSVNGDNCLTIDMGIDGTLTTNDIVDLHSPDEFHLLGRKDNVIITGGLKVFPEKAEKILEPCMQNRRYYITSRRSLKWGEEVILVIEGEEMQLPDFQKLNMHPYERPHDVIFQEKIPLTSSGKIIRCKY